MKGRNKIKLKKTAEREGEREVGGGGGRGSLDTRAEIRTEDFQGHCYRFWRRIVFV